jgi:hypothetical protein
MQRKKRCPFALNDAMILSYDANLGRMEFSERNSVARSGLPRASNTSAMRTQAL